MKYQNISHGIFLSRPNRFIAKVLIDGREETVHVKNTGRCKELLISGVPVVIAASDNPNRKTKYDLITVYKNGVPVNIDSQAPNIVAAQWLPQSHLFGPNLTLRREVTFGSSRFDLYAEDGERRAFIEVKGVTLEQHGVARFPDAPTERGIKHLLELICAKEQGYEAYVLFVIQMKGVHTFEPNVATHPAFAEALRKAVAAGVKVLAMDCQVTEDSLQIDAPVAVGKL